MTFVLLDEVEAIHNAVLTPRELTGRARDKSLEGALARVDIRLAYGMTGDVFVLAAAYAVAIARGHCFNDGNRRTAYETMVVCLELNSVSLRFSAEEVGPTIVAVAQGGDRRRRSGGLAPRPREYIDGSNSRKT